MRAEQFTAAVAHHGEGPIWDDRIDSVVWVDMFRGDVLATSVDSLTSRHHVGEVAACVVPRLSGGYIIANERGFVSLDGAVQETLVTEVWTDPSIRMNDGACDPLGRFYCGSMAYDAQPSQGALYRLDPDLNIHLVFGGITISNGLAWSQNGSVAYYVDSATNRIDVCSSDLEHRAPFVSIGNEVGEPDGLTVDAEGGVWVAMWGGSTVRRYDSDGDLDAVIDLPVRQPSSCAFGGADLDTLFISTSAHGLGDPEPQAGALFAVSPGVKGVSTRAFGG